MLPPAGMLKFEMLTAPDDEATGQVAPPSPTHVHDHGSTIRAGTVINRSAEDTSLGPAFATTALYTTV